MPRATGNASIMDGSPLARLHGFRLVQDIGRHVDSKTLSETASSSEQSPTYVLSHVLQVGHPPVASFNDRQTHCHRYSLFFRAEVSTGSDPALEAADASDRVLNWLGSPQTQRAACVSTRVLAAPARWTQTQEWNGVTPRSQQSRQPHANGAAQDAASTPGHCRTGEMDSNARTRLLTQAARRQSRQPHANAWRLMKSATGSDPALEARMLAIEC